MFHLNSIRRKYGVFFSRAVLFLLLSFASFSTQAGVFTLPQFLDPGEMQLGFEPEFVFTHRGGPGIQGHFAYGVNDLSNLHLWAGTGSEPRKFRVGSYYSFDFIPDLDGQIGAGIALGAQFLRQTFWNRWDVMVVPYLHEGFISVENGALGSGFSKKGRAKKTGTSFAEKDDSEETSDAREQAVTEPFVAFPIGYAYLNREWQWASALVIGGLFHSTDYLTYVLELGINVNQSESYLSGGLAFQF